MYVIEGFPTRFPIAPSLPYRFAFQRLIEGLLLPSLGRCRLFLTLFFPQPPLTLSASDELFLARPWMSCLCHDRNRMVHATAPLQGRREGTFKSVAEVFSPTSAIVEISWTEAGLPPIWLVISFILSSYPPFPPLLFFIFSKATPSLLFLAAIFHLVRSICVDTTSEDESYCRRWVRNANNPTPNYGLPNAQLRAWGWIGRRT